MKWPDLTSLPCFSEAKLAHAIDISRDYLSCALYERGMTLIDDTIYFGHIDDYLADTPVSARVAFVLLSPDDERQQPASCHNVAVFKNEEAFRTCFDMLVREFRVVRAIERSIFALTDLIAGNESFERMAQLISQAFGCPATIADTAYSFIAVFGDFGSLHANLSNETVRGRVDPAIQAQINRTDVFHPLGIRHRPQSFSTGLLNKRDELIYNNSVLIYVNTMIVGSLSLFTAGDTLPRTRLSYLPTIAQMLSLQFQKNTYWYENKGTYFTHLLNDLIHGDEDLLISEEDVRRRLRVGGYSLRRYKMIVYIDLSDENFTDHEMHVFSKHVQDDMNNAIYFAKDGNLTFLLSRDDLEPVEDLERRAIANQRASGMDQTLLKVGISSYFTNILDIKAYYKQALAAIAVGSRMDRGRKTYTYNEYRTYHLFSHIKEGTDLSMFYFEPLLGVIEEDQEKGSNLAYTLYRYLLDPEHPLDVCKWLFIHKNTLYFRLNKAKEIMNRNFRDGQVAADILMTFKLFKWQGIFDHLVANPGKPKR